MSGGFTCSKMGQVKEKREGEKKKKREVARKGRGEADIERSNIARFSEPREIGK